MASEANGGEPLRGGDPRGRVDKAPAGETRGGSAAGNGGPKKKTKKKKRTTASGHVSGRRTRGRRRRKIQLVRHFGR